jgi:V8-like Glu-specific endopeptidase
MSTKKEKSLDDLTLYQLTRELREREKNVSHEEKPGESKEKGLATSTISKRRGGISAVSTKKIHDVKKSKQKVVYGVDNRQDYYQLSQQQKDECDGVVSLFFNDDIMDGGNGQSKIRTGVFGDAYGLCQEEKFREQPIGAFCSGFLVGDDLVATAGHCIDEAEVTNVSFVFGYRMNSENQPQTTINSSEVYRGKEIVGRKLTDDGTDWCLVKLDRPVRNHRTFKIRKKGRIGEDQRVHVMGFPCGLPLKYAGGSWVRNNQNEAYFVANCDTFGGNSGSCVINDNTGEVEGILVRGETDFDNVEGCAMSLICPDTGCRGEDITRTTEFADLVHE